MNQILHIILIFFWAPRRHKCIESNLLMECLDELGVHTGAAASRGGEPRQRRANFQLYQFSDNASQQHQAKRNALRVCCPSTARDSYLGIELALRGFSFLCCTFRPLHLPHSHSQQVTRKFEQGKEPMIGSPHASGFMCGTLIQFYNALRSTFAPH